jgi:hypothetical protein
MLAVHRLFVFAVKAFSLIGAAKQGCQIFIGANIPKREKYT